MNDPEAIARWQRINARLTTSGRLDVDDLDRLAALGVAQVINLALADSPGILIDEAQQLRMRGIAYVHIPVPFAQPDNGHFARFCEAMADSDECATHVHCVLNWRVSAFVYRWHHEVCGMAERDARALMQRQWEPETSDHPDAPAWVRFIAD